MPLSSAHGRSGFDRMARRAFARERPGRGRRDHVHAGQRPRRARRICRRPYPRRALPRHRRAVRPRRSQRRTCFRRRTSSAPRCKSSASAATTASSSTTTARCAPPRAAGSCCAIMARNGSRSSMAGSANGATKAVRSKAAIRRRAKPASTPTASRRSRRQVRHPRRARRPAGRCPRPRPVRRQRARPAPRGCRRPYPGIAQPAVRSALQRRRHLQARGRIARGVRRRRRPIPSARSSPAAARGSPPIADLRRASARQPRRAALRWKLERMGRRSGHAQGGRRRPSRRQAGVSRSSNPDSADRIGAIARPKPDWARRLRPVGKAALQAPPRRRPRSAPNGR